MILIQFTIVLQVRSMTLSKLCQIERRIVDHTAYGLYQSPLPNFSIIRTWSIYELSFFQNIFYSPYSSAVMILPCLLFGSAIVWYTFSYISLVLNNLLSPTIISNLFARERATFKRFGDWANLNLLVLDNQLPDIYQSSVFDFFILYAVASDHWYNNDIPFHSLESIYGTDTNRNLSTIKVSCHILQ